MSERDQRVRTAALEWMATVGPLLIDLDGPTLAARVAAESLMPVCTAMAGEGLCDLCCAGEFFSVFDITDAGRAALAEGGEQ